MVYEFAGQQYTVQMPDDPGPQVQLQITPVGNAALPQAVYPQQPPYGVADQVVYPAYYGAPYYYPPIGVSLGFGWGGYRRGR